MQQIVRRTVGMTAALAAAALLAAGCGDSDEDKAANQASSLASQAQATMGQITESVKSAMPTAMPSGTDVEVTAADGTKIKLTGPIAVKYAAVTPDQKKNLGAPKTGKENSGKGDNGVVYQQFDGGVITAKNDSAGTPAYITWGKIRDAWNVPRDDKGNPAAGGKYGSAGALGAATSDETDNAGVKQSTFERGKITWDSKTDKVEVTVNGMVVPAK